MEQREYVELVPKNLVIYTVVKQRLAKGKFISYGHFWRSAFRARNN